MHPLIYPVVILIASFGQAPFGVAADRLPERTSSQAGVTVKVAPRVLAATGWEFEVTLDTHSQELKDDLLKTAALISDTGVAAAPTGWAVDAAAGHHRKGVLRFAAISPAPAYIELRIQRTGESAPRLFRWQLR